MANNESHKTKPITLTKLVPAEYRNWVVQAKASLGLSKYLEIVQGTELNPTPANAQGINVALGTCINDWNHRHTLAREALLKTLDSVELMKVYPVRESAVAIWTCLYDEYGQVLDIKYIHADNQFHALRKAPEDLDGSLHQPIHEASSRC